MLKGHSKEFSIKESFFKLQRLGFQQNIKTHILELAATLYKFETILYMEH